MTTDLRARLREALNQPRRTAPIASLAVTEQADLSSLGGTWFQSAHGPGYVIESVYDAGHAHGDIPLHHALALDTRRLAAQVRDPRLGEVAPADLLYVDTETTGLGGAGAMVFLAGVARFEGSLLRMKQYLLPSPAYESGLLGGVSQDLATAGALVSYNGKSFDVPLLESRYILSRLRPDLRDRPHLDLLHPNRRLFRGVLPSHRLTEIEPALLGFHRESDCPSWEVPERYFRFQRDSDPTWIRPVLRHNAWDILSLVALAAHLAQVCGSDAHPLQAGRAAEYAGDFPAAAEYFARCAEATTSRAERVEALERAARCARRAGDHESAARWWRRLAAEPRARRLLPLVELAKHSEHRERDPSAALRFVEQALALAREGLVRAGPEGAETSVAALEHRAARLRRKSTPGR